MSREWVIDASVGVKPYLAEDLSEVAEKFFQKARIDRSSLFVPDLFYNECANILWKHARRSEIPAADAQRSLRSLTSVRLFPVSSALLARDALDLALKFDITAYDASYVVLSEKLELPLVTADEKLIRKLASTGTDIHWLGNLPA